MKEGSGSVVAKQATATATAVGVTATAMGWSAEGAVETVVMATLVAAMMVGRREVPPVAYWGAGEDLCYI